MIDKEYRIYRGKSKENEKWVEGYYIKRAGTTIKNVKRIYYDILVPDFKNGYTL